MEDQGFQDGGRQEMVLMSRKGPTSLLGALDEIDAEEGKRKHLGTFDYNIQKVASSNFAGEIKNHEMHATAR